jgi:hypothetical protein
LGYSSDLYGIAIGETTKYLKYDPTNGLRIAGDITATVGNIGGFTIGADYIRDAANSFGLASTVTAGVDTRFWAGATMANIATAPFRVDELGNVKVSSLERNDFHWFTFFESIDGYGKPVVGASSSVILDTSEGVILTAGTANADQARFGKTLPAIINFSWAKDRTFTTSVKFSSITQQEAYITTGLASGNNFLGFYVLDGDWYVVWRNNGGSINSSGSMMAISAGTIYKLKAVLKAGSKIDFYMDDTLIYTATTDLPSDTGNSTFPLFAEINHNGADGIAKSLTINYIDFWQAN